MNKLSESNPMETPQSDLPQVIQHGKNQTPPVEEQPQQPKYDFPTEIIELPSMGLLYPEGHPLAAGKIEIKYMTAREEDILSTQSYIKQGVVLDKLCEAVIVTKGVKFDDLLVGDKNALLLAARAYGYGPEYETKVTTSAGNEVPITIDLSSVPHKVFDETLITPHVNEFEYTLPKAGNVIKFKILTVGDQKRIDSDLKGLRKAQDIYGTQNLTTRFRYMILSVDGNTDKSNINKFIQNMLAVDSRAFREYINKISPDVDLEVEGEDPETGEPFRNNFEIGVDLFYPDFKG